MDSISRCQHNYAGVGGPVRCGGGSRGGGVGGRRSGRHFKFVSGSIAVCGIPQGREEGTCEIFEMFEREGEKCGEGYILVHYFLVHVVDRPPPTIDVSKQGINEIAYYLLPVFLCPNHGYIEVHAPTISLISREARARSALINAVFWANHVPNWINRSTT